MGSHKAKRFYSEEVNQPSAGADYNVSGDIAPNAKGNYFVAGMFNEQPYYRRQDSAWFIWWHEFPPFWVISSELAVFGPSYWQKDGPITGSYTPAGTATGTALVSAGKN